MRRKVVWAVTAFVMTIAAASPVHGDERDAPGSEHRRSSKTMHALIGTYAGLQVLDVASTRAALSNGAVETNPIIGSMGGNAGQFIAVKAVTTAATIGVVKALQKKSPKMAIVTMAVVNGVTAAVVARNIRNARR
jgi:hypothetical protein